MNNLTKSDKNLKVYIAGHRGLVGSAVQRKFEQEGFGNIITRSRAQLDLLDDVAVKDFFEREKPDIVIDAAAKVGGIFANMTFPAEFIYQNLKIQNNLIHNAYLSGVQKFVFLGSTCIYPKLCPQPIKEQYFLTGPLEPTNEAYAVAKIAGINMCKYYNQQYGVKFISVMPTNVYGYNDNFDLESSHVLPAIIHKIHLAKVRQTETVPLWGTGKAIREFIFADDLADAIYFLTFNYDEKEIINVGTGVGISIKNLAEIIAEVVGYDGQFSWDNDKPDGTPKKISDISKLHSLGWQAKTTLREGIEKTYQWFVKNYRF